MKKQFLLILSLLALLVSTTVAQQVSGKITDENGDPIVGASVTAKGTSAGMVTDLDGNYNLTMPKGSTIIKFSYVGFKEQEEVVGTRTTVSALLNKRSSEN